MFLNLDNLSPWSIVTILMDEGNSLSPEEREALERQLVALVGEDDAAQLKADWGK